MSAVAVEAKKGPNGNAFKLFMQTPKLDTDAADAEDTVSTTGAASEPFRMVRRPSLTVGVGVEVVMMLNPFH